MSARAYFLLGRALPLGFFGFLVAIQGELAFAGVQHALTGTIDRGDAMYVLNRLLTLGFYGFLLAIYAIRSRAIASDHNPLAVLAAMLGSFILYALWLFPGQPRTSDLVLLGISDILLACGMLWAIYSLSYLRMRFSIVPEARGLVTVGPYWLVRHPIYLGEIVAAIGLVLPTLLTAHLAVLIAFVALQVARTVYEERVLRQVFPTEYEAYSRHVRRLIPYVF
ncbi:MAG: isoprenylcysteine carboxylmethyltransferase family protein [Candidatus Dormibacteraeota bacterium]|nr:isoprenylcysteine carboxylmethyltransferase family protein [Candidatus Dormibacteraeota bacterium]